jgi:hypothetical protein
MRMPRGFTAIPWGRGWDEGVSASARLTLRYIATRGRSHQRQRMGIWQNEELTSGPNRNPVYSEDDLARWHAT